MGDVWILSSKKKARLPRITHVFDYLLKEFQLPRQEAIQWKGENDVRVPPPQSIELYRTLKANGVPTHLYVAPREPHGWGELRHRLFKMNVELEWFDKYAKGKEYIWEKLPGEEK